MQKITPYELSAACRIFRQVDLLIDKYYGRKIEAQIKDYISANRWIMFPDRGITSLREGVSFPLPNVYISFKNDEISDNGKGRTNGYTGFTYHNKDAMLWLRQILRLKSKNNQFIDILRDFGDEWIIDISHKTKVDYYEAIPRYSTFATAAPSTVTAEEIQQYIEDSDNNLLFPGDILHDGHPVKSDITVFSVSKDITEDTFDNDIKKVFGLFLKALNLK